MIGLYTVKFLFFKLYIYDILHVQICLLKIMGIHLNTLELHWARPWVRRWLNPIFDDGCQFRLHSKPVCDGIRPARGVARLLRRRRWSAVTMSSTEVSRRCQGPLCNFSLVWASL